VCRRKNWREKLHLAQEAVAAGGVGVVGEIRSKMAGEYKNQHFVTEAYLRAWCDPQTPDDGAFVWKVSKKSPSISRKSPRSLCSEVDFYTVTDSK
jgi:hypothetical protein